MPKWFTQLRSSDLRPGKSISYRASLSGTIVFTARNSTAWKVLERQGDEITAYDLSVPRHVAPWFTIRLSDVTGYYPATALDRARKAA